MELVMSENIKKMKIVNDAYKFELELAKRCLQTYKDDFTKTRKKLNYEQELFQLDLIKSIEKEIRILEMKINKFL